MKHMKLIVAALIACALAFVASPASAQVHGEGHGHSHEGKREDLGTTQILGMNFTATQIGTVEPGKEGIFEVRASNVTKAPKAIRIWVGVASGEGSVKAKASGEGGAWETHLEIPKPLPTSTRLWVEIQPDSGPKAKASFELKK